MLGGYVDAVERAVKARDVVHVGPVDRLDVDETL